MATDSAQTGAEWSCAGTDQVPVSMQCQCMRQTKRNQTDHRIIYIIVDVYSCMTTLVMFMVLNYQEIRLDLTD